MFLQSIVCGKHLLQVLEVELQEAIDLLMVILGELVEQARPLVRAAVAQQRHNDGDDVLLVLRERRMMVPVVSGGERRKVMWAHWR